VDRCDVVITGFRLNAVEKPAAALQRVLQVSEDEARALSKRFPCVVLADAPSVAAQPLMAALREAGAHVQLREPGRSMPPETGGKTMPPEGFGEPHAPPRALRSEPVRGPASVPAPAPGASTAHKSVPAPAPGAPPPSGPAAIPPPAPSAPAAPDAYGLFNMSPATASPPVAARVSAYQLGELEVVATKSQPAPALFASKSQPAPAPPATKSQPAPALFASPSQPAPAMTATKSQPAPAMTATKSQPAPAMTAIKSQPAPAMTAAKSQPAPAMTAAKSQPAPSPVPDMAGMQMLNNGFRPTGEFGPALEIDVAALADRSARVQSTFQPNAEPEAQAKPKRRGFFATLLMPIVFFSTAVPHALALTGVAAASGAAVYIVRKSDDPDELDHARTDDSDSEESGEADGATTQRKGRRGLAARLNEMTGGKLSGVLGMFSSEVAEADEQGKDLDGIEGSELAGHEYGDNDGAREATHPLLRTAPKAMEPSIAAILRSRIRGVSKISIEWPEGTKPEGFVECMLLDTKHSENLKELESTGARVDVPPAVQEQIDDHIGTLQAANGATAVEFVPICLAN